MADVEKTVIVDIRYDTQGAIESINKLTDNVEHLENKQKELKQALKDGTITQKEYGIALAENREQLKKSKAERSTMIKQLQAEKGSINELRAQIKQLTLQRDKLNIKTKEGRIQAQKYTRQINQMSKQISTVSKRNKGLTASLKSVATGFLGVTALIYGVFRAIKSAVGIVVSFEKQMDKVQAVTGATSEEMAALTRNAKELGGTTTQTATQVGELQEEFAKLGFSTREILDATEATIMLAEAADAELSQAAIVAASTLRGFGLEAKETQRVVDVMAKSFSSSSLDINKFQTAMGQVAPAAKASNVEIERATSLIGTLTDAGLDASTAGTSLRNIFLENAKSGRTFDESMRMIQQSTNKNATAMELFGKRGAVAGLVLADNTKKTKELTETLDNAAGAAKNMADIMRDNLAGDVTLLKSAWEGFILGAGDGEGIFKKIARGMVQALTSLLQFLTGFRNKFVEQWNDLITQSSVFRGAIAVLTEAVKLNFKLMIDAALLAIEPFKLLGKTIRDVLTGNFKEIRGNFSEMVDNIKMRAKDMANDVVSAGTNIANAFSGKDVEKYLFKQKEVADVLSDINEKTQVLTDNTEKYNTVLDEKNKKENESIELHKRQEEALRKLNDLQNKNILDSINNLDEKQQKEIEFEKADFERKIGNKELIDEEIELLEAEHKERLGEIDNKYKDLRLENEKTVLDTILQSVDEIGESVGAMTDERIALQSKLLGSMTKFANLEEKTEKEKFEAFGGFASNLNAITMRNFQDELDAAVYFRDRQLEVVGDNVEAQKRIEEDYARKVADIQRKQFNDEKRKAITDTIINTAVAVVKALPNVILAGIVAGMGAAQSAIIATKQFNPSSYAEGGEMVLFGGRRHSDGGTHLYGTDGSHIEVEKGESAYVLNRDATSHIAALSAINESFGGRSLNTKSRFMQEGGQIDQRPTLTAEDLAEAFKQITIVTTVDDIKTGISEFDNVVNNGII